MDGILDARIEALTPAARARLERLYDIRRVTAASDPPVQLEPWLAETFGSVDAVRRQSIVKVTNVATMEAALFAPLRGRRPLQGPNHTDDLRAEIDATVGDPFCHPQDGTPADLFGRVRGARTVTGANAAMADAHHAVIVFEEHDPLAFDAELVEDVFSVGRRWAEKARETDPSAVNYLLAWNCLWRAGGSIIHGHAQALLGSGPHYSGILRFRRDVERYRAEHGSELVADMVQTHRDLGLAAAIDDGVTVIASLTPIKESELLVIGAAGTDEREPAFVRAVARTLVSYRDRIGVRSFNLALWRPPLTDDGSVPDGWHGIPPIVRLVDRGAPFQRPSDIGAMELYGTPIVGSDPFQLIEQILGLQGS